MQLDQTMIGAATHGLAALTYLILTALLAGTWRRGWQSGYRQSGCWHGAALIAATVATAVWAGVETAAHLTQHMPEPVRATALLLRSAAWLLFLLVVLREATHGRAAGFW